MGSFLSRGYQYSLLWSGSKNKFQHKLNHVGRGCWNPKWCFIRWIKFAFSSKFHLGTQSQGNPTVVKNMFSISSTQMNGPLVVPMWIHWTIDCGTREKRLPAHINMQLWVVWRLVQWRLCEKYCSILSVKLLMLGPGDFKLV